MRLIRKIFPQNHPDVIKQQYSIPDKIDWDIELNKHGLVATSKDLPGLVTNADNPQELLEMINDAVLEYFDVPTLESDYVFDQLQLHGQGTVTLEKADQQKQYA